MSFGPGTGWERFSPVVEDVEEYVDNDDYYDGGYDDEITPENISWDSESRYYNGD